MDLGSLSPRPLDLLFPLGGFLSTFLFQASSEEVGERKRSKRLPVRELELLDDEMILLHFQVLIQNLLPQVSPAPALLLTYMDHKERTIFSKFSQ